MNKSPLVFLLLVFAVSTLLSQTPSPTSSPAPAVKTPQPDDEGQVIKVDSRLVVVPVSVVDSNGEPVQGLKAENFRIREESKQQTIDSVGNAENVPLEIALLFDVSASTDAMFKFQQETAAKFLQDVLRPNDRATIYTIGTKPSLIQPRETAEKSIIAVKTVTPTKQDTAFYDTVAVAADYLRRSAPDGTRRVILVISDGEDTNSARIAKAIQDGYAKVDVNALDAKRLYQLTVAKRDEASLKERGRVSKSLQDADTVFYSINPGGGSVQLNKGAIFGQETMQRFADETGGTSFLPKFQPIETPDSMQNSVNVRKNTETLERIFRQIASELRAQYLVQYYSESEFPANKFVKLDVGVTAPGNPRVRARQGYYVKKS